MAAYDDDDFDDLLGDIDFDGGSSSKKSASKHGVIFSTGIDVAKGIGDSLLSDPLAKVGAIAREIMPSSVRYEYGELESAVSEVKDEITKGLDDVKKLSKQFAKVSSGLLPEGSKLHKLLKDFGTDESAGQEREKSKEEQEQDKINAAILEALGQSDRKQANDALLKEVMASKREASSQQVLKHVLGELKLANTFNNDVVYKFYSKNLELQYKQLYKTSELVELTKYSWEIQRKQTEAILNNVALPDIIKLRALEAMKDKRLMARSRGSMFGKYFKDFDPFANLKKNIIGNVRNRIQGATQGLQSAIMGAESMQGMKEMMAGMGDMPGMSKGFLMGNMIGDWVRAKTLGNIGDRLGKTKMGQKFVYNFKDAFADPRAFFKSLNDKEKGDTLGSKWKKRLFGGIASLTGSPEKKTVDFVNENLDDARSFDGRAHQAIVKVIPGLLTRIYGAIKTGLKVDDSDIEKNALYFDNKTGSFMNSERLKETIRKDMRHAVNNDGLKWALESFLRLYSDVGVEFDKNEKKAIAIGVARYMMDRNSSVNSSTIVSDNFIKAIGGKVAEKVRSGGIKLIQQSKEDPYVQDSISSSLTNIRKSLPNMNNRLQDLHKSGYMNIAGSMGLTNQDMSTGSWRKNDKNNDRLVAAAVGDIEFDGSTLKAEEEFADKLEADRAEQAELFGDVKATGVTAKNWIGSTKIGAMGISAFNRLSNTRTYQNAAKAFSAGKSRVQRSIDAAKGFRARQEQRLIDFFNQDPQAAVQVFHNKRMEVQSMLTPEKLRTYPEKTLNKLQSTLTSTQNKVKKTVNDIQNKIMDGSLSNDVKEKYQTAKKEVDKITNDFIADCHDFGLTEEKIKEYNNKVQNVAREVTAQAKGKVKSNSVFRRFMGSKYGKFSAMGVGNLANLYSKGFAGAKGLLSSVKEKGIRGTVSGVSNRFKEYLAKKKEDMQRAGSWRNRFKKFVPFLRDGEKKGKSGSLFSAKNMVKGLAIGGIGMLAIGLIKKLGISMEDVVNFGKKTVKGIMDIGGLIGSAFSVVVPVISGIAGAIGKFLNFLGIGDGGEEGSGGGGGSGLGAIAGTALGLWATNKLMFGIPGKVAKLGWWASKKAGKFLFGRSKGWQAAKALGSAAMGGAVRGAGKLAWGATKLVGKTAVLSAMAAPKLAAYALGGDVLANGAKKLAGGAGELAAGAKNTVTNAASGAKGWLSSKWDSLKGLATSAKDKVASTTGKIMDKMPTPSKIKAKLSGALKDLASVAERKLGKNGGKLVLGRIAKKVGVKLSALATGAAVAATGIGAILGALISAVSMAMFAYDIFSIGRLMWKGHSLTASLSIHFLGADITDDNVKDIPSAPEDKEIMAEIAQAEQDAKDNKDAGGAKQDLKTTQSEIDKEMSSSSSTSDPSSTTTSTITNTTNDKTIQSQSVASKPFVPPRNFKYTGIGSVSGWFEAKNNPATVSTGAGDFGGVSYGTWQLSSKAGTLAQYLKSSKYGSELSKYTPGTNAFNAKWKEIAARDPEGFQKDQENFIKRTHYDPCVAKLKEIGLDVNKRSEAFKAMVFSTSVSLGAAGGFKSIKRAIEIAGLNPATASDEELINAIYDHEADSVGTRYRSSSLRVQNSRRNRAMTEKGMILNLLKENPATTSVGKETISSEPTPNDVAKTASSVVTQDTAVKDSVLFDISGSRGKTIWNRETGEIKYTDSDTRSITLTADGKLKSNVPYGDTLPKEIHELSKSINSGKGYYVDTAKAMKELGLIGNEKKPLDVASTTTTSTPPNTTSLAQPVAYTPTASTTPVARSSGGKMSMPKISMGGVEDILKQQLMVQMQMLNKLTDIVTNTNVFAEFSKNRAKEQDGPTMTPQPAISLERNEDFKHVMGSNMTV